MIGWMLWATAVSALLGICALLGERVARAAGWSGRWAWVLATAGAVWLQAGSLLRDSSAAPGPALTDPVWLGSLQAGVEAAARAAPAVPAGTHWGIIGAWLAASVLLAAGLIGGLRRLHTRSALWPRVRLFGHEVLVSDGFGPALLGVVSPAIVLPRSLLALDDDAVRIACEHEIEHRRAADPLLFVASATLLVATPWNVAFWWMASRLRLAAELDCDRRVLRAGVRRREYGALLLRLGSGAHESHAPAAIPAFARPVSLLERRLRMMTHGVRNGGPVGTLLMMGAVALLGVTACESEAPTVAAEPVVVEAERPADARGEVTIRGFSSIGLGNQPLIYVDGVRIESDAATAGGSALEELEPDDIESIEVIKGPAASRLYGQAATGGVIQIRTKAAGSDAVH